MDDAKILDFAGKVRTRDQVVEAIKSAIAAEREACATVAADYYRKSTFNSRVRSLGQDAADGIAAAIRNRST